MEWFFSMTTLDHTQCKHDESGHSGSRLRLEILPHPTYSPDFAPSDYHLFSCLYNNLLGAEFPSTTTLSSKIGSTNFSRSNRRMSSSVGSNVERQSWIMEENTQLIECLIICVKNKLFRSVKEQHVLIHQPTSYQFIDYPSIRRYIL
jgi:hypothetical protein